MQARDHRKSHTSKKLKALSFLPLWSRADALGAGHISNLL